MIIVQNDDEELEEAQEGEDNVEEVKALMDSEPQLSLHALKILTTTRQCDLRVKWEKEFYVS